MKKTSGILAFLVMAVLLPGMFSAPARAAQQLRILAPAEAETLACGETLQLSAEDENGAAVDPALLDWTVTPGTGAASVDAAGALTGETAGTVTVRAAEKENADVFAELGLTVTEDISGGQTAANAQTPARAPALLAASGSGSSAELQLTNLVVFVRFAGDTAEDFNETMSYKPMRSAWADLRERYDNTVTGASDSTYPCSVDDSFCAYIRAVSCGKAEVFNIFPQSYDDAGVAKIAYLNLSRTKAQVDDNDELVIDEVIKAFGSGALSLPAGAVLDRRESGVLDNLTIIIQGAADDSGIMRSHKAVSSATGTIGGKYVRTYNILCGDTLLTSKAGLIAHEFLHTIGLPDLYRSSGDGDPVGAWDIMASEGSFLQYPLSYQRASQGWLTLPEITASGDYYLTSPLDGGGNQGFIIRSPLSESEFFVVEYREKNTNTSFRGFELKIPESGVIVYRVNTAVENRTNIAGKDYIYIFRDGETGLTDAYSADGVRSGAALTAGESRGTQNLSDTFASNTIFYADGTNSGIVVTADGEQADGTMKITVSYPDYAGLDLWDKAGGAPAATAARDGNALAADDSGCIYMAGIVSDGSGDAVRVKKWNGSAWTDLGIAGRTDGIDVSIACFGGAVYVSYAKTDGSAAVAKYSGSAWSTVFTSNGGNANPAQLACDAQNLYAAYSSADGDVIRLAKLNAAKSGFTALGSITGNYFSVPALAVYKGAAVLVSNDYFAANAPTLVQLYDEQRQSFVQLGSFAKAQSVRAVVSGDSLWVMRKPQEGKSAYIARYDGDSWDADITYTAASAFTEFGLAAFGGSPVVMAAPADVCRVYTLENGAFVQRGHDVRSAASGCDMLVSDGVIYVSATGNSDGTLQLYSKSAGVLSSNARLASLSAGTAALTPAFSANTQNYTAAVSADTGTVTIAAAAQDAGAAVTGTGTFSLAYGVNTFTVRVTAADGVASKDYTLSITRREIPLTSFGLSCPAEMMAGENGEAVLRDIRPGNATTDLAATVYTSSNEAVLRVVSSGNTGAAVRAQGAGTAVLTARSANGKTASCTVRVYSIGKAQRLSAGLVPAVPALGLQGGEETTLEIYASGAPETAVDAGLLTFTTSNASLATVDGQGVVLANGNGASGTVRVTAKLTNDPAGRSAYRDIRIIARQAQALTVTSAGMTQGGVFVIDNDAQTILLDAADVTATPGGYQLRLTAAAYDKDGAVLAGTGVTWTSSDTDIGTVAAQSGTGDGIVTVRGAKAGAFTVTATAKDLTKAQSSVSVYVRDYAPRLEQASVTLNPWLTAGVDIDVLPSYGNEVTAAELRVPVTVNRATTYEVSETLAVTRVGSSDVWTIRNVDGSGNATLPANGTIRAKLCVTGQNGVVYELPLNITVRSEQPSVTVKQAQRFNLFYTDSTADVTVTAKNGAVTDAVLTGTPTLAGRYTDGTLTVRYADADDPASGYVSGKPVLRGTLVVTVAGYNWPVNCAFSLATETVKPNIALSAGSGIVNTIVGENRSVSFTLIDRASKQTVALDRAATLDKVSAAGFAALATSGSGMTLTLQPVNGKYVSGTATIGIRQNNWLTAVQYTYGVTAVTSVPAAKVSGTLKLSSVFSGTTDLAGADVTLNQGNLALRGESIALTSTNAAAAAALDVTYADGRVTAKFKDGADPTALRNGTYAFTFVPAADDGTAAGFALKAVTVNVNVTNSLPGVRVKGNITLNRASWNEAAGAAQPYGTTELAVTASRDALVTAAAAQADQAALLDGTAQTLESAETDASKRAEAAKLTVVYEDGGITAAMTDGTVKAGSYRYTLPVNFMDGLTPRWKMNLTVTVNVTDRAPGMKLQTNTLRLNRNLTGETAASAVTSADAWFEVTGMTFTQVTGPSAGTIALGYEDGAITARCAGLAANGTYKWTAQPTYTEKTTGRTVQGTAAAVSVTVYAAVPAARVSAKGSLDVLDRENSRIEYTLTGMSNIAGSAAGYVLQGPDAAKFTSSSAEVNGKQVVTLQLKEAESYAAGTTYRIQLGFSVPGVSEYALTPVLSVRVSQSAVRAAAGPAKHAVYQSNSARTYADTVTLTAPATGKIGSVTVNRSATSAQVLQALGAYGCEIVAGGKTAEATYTLTNTSRLRVGSTYTLVLDVMPANAAADARPVQVRVSLSVKP
ncbi:MAG: cadherin-like beta sandwich domain-containing protein [Oscillospiraceae bacterium]|nr:cadherin-like beta sandwich domain-containing protein [Oscillospiraceae bacterium]